MNLKRFLRKSEVRPFCSALILCAGNSQRMGQDKIFMDIDGVSVISRTVSVFESCTMIDEIILVVRQDMLQPISEIVDQNHWSKVKKVIIGGQTRSESALLGSQETNEKTELIAVHDCARPFVTDDLICRTVLAAKEYRCAVPGIKMTDSVKMLDSKGFAVSNIDRESLIRVQTPQVFESTIYKAAMTFVAEHSIEITDDASALEKLGFPCFVVPGEEDNIKLTTGADLLKAEMILNKRKHNS